MTDPTAQADAPAIRDGERESAELRRLVARLEDEVVELRAAVEAVSSLADQISDGVACAQARGEAPTTGTVPHFGLLWAVRTLHTHVDALDAKLSGTADTGTYP